jgi:uncharacterized protein
MGGRARGFGAEVPGRGMSGSLDYAAAWLAFLVSPAAPPRAMSLLELDGYLTGVIVAPSLIPSGRWIAGLWDGEEPVFDDAAQIQSVLGAVSAMFNARSQAIEDSLRRLEADRVCDYRPPFMSGDGKPPHDAVRTWMSGFWRAMRLDPNSWTALGEDERMQPIITPFVGFIDFGHDPEFEPADDIEERLDDAAATIPRAVLLLRKIAKIRANRPAPAIASRSAKVGRNNPCPCGSGTKFKRCCANA